MCLIVLSPIKLFLQVGVLIAKLLITQDVFTPIINVFTILLPFGFLSDNFESLKSVIQQKTHVLYGLTLKHDHSDDDDDRVLRDFYYLERSINLREVQAKIGGITITYWLVFQYTVLFVLAKLVSYYLFSSTLWVPKNWDL